MRGICQQLFRFASVVFCSFLTACSSGGGRGDGPGNSSSVIFSPSNLSETYGVGESIEFSVQATIIAELSGSVYVYIVDNTGVITPDVTVTANPDGTYTAVLKTSPSLSVGRHQGHLELRLCRDSGCSSQFTGSPAFLPYDLNVISGVNLTPLTPWVNVNNWETYQGNAAHTGYVPVTLDPANFTPRWSWVTPDAGNGIEPVVIADGLVYVTSAGLFSGSSNLYALSESDMTTHWKSGLGAAPRANPPAVSGGKVFVATSGHSDTFMWSFDASTGAQLSKTAFSSQWEHYYAPVIDGQAVYTNGGYYGGVNAFNFADGSAKWFLGLNQYDEWTPAVDENYVYAYVGESCSGCNNAGLNVINKSNGTLAFRINDPQFDWKGWSMYGSPVIGSNNSVIVVNGRTTYYVNDPYFRNSATLISFNIASRSVNWQVTASYWGNPAVANGVIYTTNYYPYQLEARSETTGALLWSWQPTRSDETGFYGDLIASDNLVFVSTNRRVYAISLSTHQPVWSYWRAGTTAISANGVLYIVASGGRLGAVNLK